MAGHFVEEENGLEIIVELSPGTGQEYFRHEHGLTELEADLKMVQMNTNNSKDGLWIISKNWSR